MPTSSGGSAQDSQILEQQPGHLVLPIHLRRVHRRIRACPHRARSRGRRAGGPRGHRGLSRARSPPSPCQSADELPDPRPLARIDVRRRARPAAAPQAAPAAPIAMLTRCWLPPESVPRPGHARRSVSSVCRQHPRHRRLRIFDALEPREQLQVLLNGELRVERPAAAGPSPTAQPRRRAVAEADLPGARWQRAGKD